MTGRGFPAGNLRAGPGCCCWFPRGARRRSGRGAGRARPPGRALLPPAGRAAHRACRSLRGECAFAPASLMCLFIYRGNGVKRLHLLSRQAAALWLDTPGGGRGSVVPPKPRAVGRGCEVLNTAACKQWED